MSSRVVRRRGLTCALATVLAVVGTLVWLQPAEAMYDAGIGNASPPTTTTSAEGSGTGCLVPELRGFRLRVAKAELEWANCSLGQVRTRRAAAWKRGYVLSQAYPVNTVLRSGQRVGVTVGR